MIPARRLMCHLTLFILCLWGQIIQRFSKNPTRCQSTLYESPLSAHPFSVVLYVSWVAVIIHIIFFSYSGIMPYICCVSAVQHYVSAYLNLRAYEYNYVVVVDKIARFGDLSPNWWLLGARGGANFNVEIWLLPGFFEPSWLFTYSHALSTRTFKKRGLIWSFSFSAFQESR